MGKQGAEEIGGVDLLIPLLTCSFWEWGAMILRTTAVESAQFGVDQRVWLVLRFSHEWLSSLQTCLHFLTRWVPFC